MIEITEKEVMNFKGALRGMRNPMESWNQSDSDFGCEYMTCCDVCSRGCSKRDKEFIIGPNDLALAQKLILGGTDHSKFMRQILVSMDINAPLYWWKEMDTYKVATVANSCSTMHKLATTPITKELFSFDLELSQIFFDCTPGYDLICADDYIIESCERLRQKYLETKDKRYWRALIQLLPESWNQKRTWTANYQTLRNIYFARQNHKLQEWHNFCKMIEELPYAKELICVKGEK